MKKIKKDGVELLEKYTQALELIAQLQHSLSEFKLRDEESKENKDFVRDRTSELEEANAKLRSEIAERKRAEEALFDANQKDHALFNNKTVGLSYCQTIFDDSNQPIDYVVLDINATYEGLVGIRREQIVGKRITEAFPGVSRDLINLHNRVAVTGQDSHFEICESTIDKWFDVNVFSPKKGYFVAIFYNVTERKRAEEALQRNEAKLRAVFNSLVEGVVFLNTKGEVEESNEVIERVRGHTRQELSDPDLDPRKRIIKPDGSLFPVDEQPAIMAMRTGEVVRDVEMGVPTSDGGMRWRLVNAQPVYDEQHQLLGAVASFFDITELKQNQEELLKYRQRLEELVGDRTKELEEKSRKLIEEMEGRKRLEAQLLQAQKLEALGSLAGGIAHDMNNLIYPIVINTETLLDEASPGTQAHEMLSQILESAHRQKDLIKQILTFSKKNMQTFKPIHLVALLEHTLRFIRSTIPSSIEIKHSVNAPVDTIMGDPTQIQQVIMNLLKNSADAIDTQRGTIEISLSTVYPEENPAKPEVRPREYLELVVQDTGQGIPPDVIDRIFDPFFTTKSVGKGSGLGLSVVHGIIQKHGGTIAFTSKVGEGSRFTVRIPLIDHGSRAHAQAVAGQDASRKNILFIDDENTIVSTIKRSLERAGYHVVGLTDAREALGLFLDDPLSFDLVITDMTMPGMTGMELGRQIREASPDIPIILCTGFADLISTQEAQDKGFTSLLTKPSSIGELKDAVSQALES